MYSHNFYTVKMVRNTVDMVYILFCLFKKLHFREFSMLENTDHSILLYRDSMFHLTKPYCWCLRSLEIFIITNDAH